MNIKRNAGVLESDQGKVITRRTIMEKGFKLYAERGIELITLPEIADASIVGRATIFHIMLAAVTRYAVGLVYVHENAAPDKELVRLEKMLLREFTRGKKCMSAG